MRTGTGRSLMGKEGELYIDPVLLQEIEASARLDQEDNGRSVTQSKRVGRTLKIVGRRRGEIKRVDIDELDWSEEGPTQSEEVRDV